MLLALLGNSMQAQNKLYGTVENNGKPLPYVTVRLLETDSTFVSGVTTDTLGKYVFSNIEKGNYLVAFSSIGYKPAFIQIKMSDKNLEVPLVTLETENVVLGEVVVKGTTFIRKKDHTLIIPDKQQLKHAYSGYDVLYNLMIPGVDVDPRSKSVSTSRGAVTLYINGVQADLREVQNLRPKDIEKVEYYDIPSGIYTGDIASINYITKEYKVGGYVTLDAEQNIGYTKGDYNIGAKIAHGNTNYTFFGGYNMAEHDGVQNQKNELLFFPDYQVNRNHMNEGGLYHSNQQYAQFKVNNKTDKRNLYALVSLTHNDTPHNDQSEQLNYTGYENKNVSSSERVSEENLKPSLCLDGVFYPTKNQRIHVMLRGNYDHNTYQRNYLEDEQRLFTKADEDLYSFRAMGVYGINLKHNSFGASFLHDHQITSSVYTGDNESWQHLWKGETLFYLNYTQYLFDKLTITLSPGASLLNYKLHGQDLQKYWTFRTNSWIRYLINAKHQLVGSFAMGNYQPDISYINTMDQNIDFLQIKRGNPNLNNPIIQEFFFTYDAQVKPFNLQFNFNYTILKNNICGDYYIGNNKLVNSYRSDTDYKKWKAEVISSCKLSKNFRTNLKLKYEKLDIAKIPISEDNFMATLDVNYYFHSFTLNAYMKTPERGLDSELLALKKSPWKYGFSLRFNKKNWLAEAGTDSPFTKHSRYTEYSPIGIYQFTQERTSRIYQRTGYVKLAYTFDFGRKTSRDKNDVDRSINSAIMKVN